MLDQAPYAQWIGMTLGDYRLEQLLGSCALGPLFLARDGTSRSPVLVRTLAVPAAQSLEAIGTYQRYLERQASHIAAMRHPYILPLVRYGLEEGVPYLVWAQVAARSLTMRLAQSGPLDVVPVGRYLDQLASALEYAHERATIHRNLSTDCVYLQLDGQLAVGDFGVRRLFELLSPGDPSSRFLGSLEACAPEQLRGERVDTYSDVYALGAVTYRLLTGQAPFAGESPAGLVEQHLHTTPPPLGLWRAGMPAALDGVLATALAKDPAQRYQHPGELANAYHQVVAPTRVTRMPFGRSRLASDVPAPRLVVSRPSGGGGQGWFPLLASATGTASRVASGTPTPMARVRVGPVAVVGLLLLILLSGGLFLAARVHSGGAVERASGTVTFFDRPGSPVGTTNGVRLDVQALGTLTPAGGHTWTLQYTGGGTTLAGSNLLARGNEIEVTEEQGQVQAPVGPMVLSAAFPPQAFVHIQHLLVSFPTTPGKNGLLVGVLRQTEALSTQATALRTASARGDATAVRCRAQNILNVLEGAHGTHYQRLDAACAASAIASAADGFGVLESSAAQVNGGTTVLTGYLAGALDHASLAATTPDATSVVRTHAQGVETAIAGMQRLASTADAAATQVLTQPHDRAPVAELVTVCAQLYDGGSPSSASAPDAQTAYTQGQLMASLMLAPSR
jgi:eukaryotic-like serine/threonine-protein kinase